MASQCWWRNAFPGLSVHLLIEFSLPKGTTPPDPEAKIVECQSSWSKTNKLILYYYYHIKIQLLILILL